MPRTPSAPAPLLGKRVLVTRPEGRSEDLAALLRARGARPVTLPMIRIVPPADRAPLERAARNLGSYDWLVFTSRNGVEAYAAARRGLGEAPLPAPGSAPRLAAVGPGTAGALEGLGRTPDVVPEEFVGEAVVDAVVDASGGSLAGRSVLLPLAELAREALPRGLADAGALVDVVTAYRTVGPDEPTAKALREAVDRRALDAITFTASSTVRFLVDVLGRDEAPARVAPLVVASIGPITTRTATELGLRVDATAEEYTHAGLVDALSACLADRDGAS